MRKTQNPRNILYLVLSIVIAAGIWYYVDEFNGRVVTQTVTGIPIEYINQDALADNGLMLAEGEDSGTSTTIDITFKGNRRHIVQLDRSKIRVTANLASITEAGVQSVKPDLTYTDRKFNSGNTSVEEQSLYIRKWSCAASSPAMWRRAIPPVRSSFLRPASPSGVRKRKLPRSAMPR